eukprot:m.84280 g.84280  ORF g.84280 m.84280 type:complete len:96 (-) comp25731_c0_seq1:423-710(-)
MCDELGPKGGLLQAYIEEAGGTSECSIEPPYAGCGDKQKKFIEKMAAANPEVLAAQTERLTNMKGKPMKEDLKLFLEQRLTILKQLSSKVAREEL